MSSVRGKEVNIQRLPRVLAISVKGTKRLKFGSCGKRVFFLHIAKVSAVILQGSEAIAPALSVSVE